MPENRSILNVCEDLVGERNIAFKREQNQTCLNYAERSNEKELNAKRALLDGFNPQKSPLQITERAFGDIFHCALGIRESTYRLTRTHPRTLQITSSYLHWSSLLREQPLPLQQPWEP